MKTPQYLGGLVVALLAFLSRCHLNAASAALAELEVAGTMNSQ